MIFVDAVSMVVRQPLSAMWAGVSVVAISLGILLIKDFRSSTKGSR